MGSFFFWNAMERSEVGKYEIEPRDFMHICGILKFCENNGERIQDCRRDLRHILCKMGIAGVTTEKADELLEKARQISNTEDQYFITIKGIIDSIVYDPSNPLSQRIEIVKYAYDHDQLKRSFCQDLCSRIADNLILQVEKILKGFSKTNKIQERWKIYRFGPGSDE